MPKIPIFLIFLSIFVIPTSAVGNGTCQEGWTWFYRSNGGWCMKVFPGSYSWWHAAGLCQSQGARLSGISSPPAPERSFIWASLFAITSNDTDIQPNVWIGARRTALCMYKQYNTGGAYCLPKFAFEWTDGFTTGVDGFAFGSGEPNNIGGLEDCVAYRYIGGSNDFDCNDTTATRGYVCGKEQIDP